MPAQGQQEFAKEKSDLLSVCLNKSRPVKLGIFPEIVELRNTNHFRTDKNLSIKGKRWEEKKEKLITSAAGAEWAADSMYIDPRPFYKW